MPIRRGKQVSAAAVGDQPRRTNTSTKEASSAATTRSAASAQVRADARGGTVHDRDDGLAAVEHRRDEPLRAVHDLAHAVGGALVPASLSGRSRPGPRRSKVPAVAAITTTRTATVLVGLVEQLDEPVPVNPDAARWPLRPVSG